MAQAVAKPAVLAVNYYAARASWAANTVQSLTFFGGQTTMPNDLGVAGILPDNRRGDITAMMVRFRTPPLTVSATSAAQARDHLLMMDARVTLFVNNVQICQGPIQMFPHPPAWIQGSNGAAPVDVGCFYVQNSGYMLMAVSHTVEPRQSIKVVIDDRGTAIATASAVLLEVVLQVADKKPVV